MNPELYRRASELFDELCKLPDTSLSEAVDRASGGDPELKDQVIRLLAADRRAHGGSFLEGRALEDAAQLLHCGTASFPHTGDTVGNYKLGERIGAGGMGVVYAAEDLRLHRRVAVKLLRPWFAAGGEEQIRRFQREARAESMLSHPHIVSIFDADFDRGCCYIAMEFVEGKTLRQLMNERSTALDVETILDLIGQTASALAAAHAAGIVHRDIKPENIMVRPDGLVKVLDFGLATLERASVLNSTASELQTKPGHVAGTIQYLSPEQVLGKRAGPPSDIFSLGVVAYELATGVRPFGGPTDGAVFDAIVNGKPAPPSSVRPALGTLLDTMILQTLQKQPDARFPSSDLRSCCRLLMRDSQSPSKSVPVLDVSKRVPSPKSLRTATILLALAVVVARAAWLYLSHGGKAQSPRQVVRLTSLPGFQLHPALSPDGTQLAFVWDGNEDNYDIYARGTNGGNLRRLTSNPAQDLSPSWSPDASQIAFVRAWPDRREIFVVGTEGGPERRVAEIRPVASPWTDRPASMRSVVGPVWSPDARWLAVSDRCSETASSDCVFLLSADGSEKRQVTTGAAVGDYDPVFSPDGKQIAFLRTLNDSGLAEIYAQELNQRAAPRRLSKDKQIVSSIAWSSDGSIFFIPNRAGSLWSIETPGGAPHPVAEVNIEAFSVSAAAHAPQLAFATSYRNVNVYRIGLKGPGGPPTLLLGSWRRNHSAQYSPDGSHIVFISDRSGVEEVWTAKADGSNARRITLTSPPRSNGSPSWSPDGSQIVYDAYIEGHTQVCLMNADGTNQRQVTTDAWDSMMPSWSQDGHFLYYVTNRDHSLTLWKRSIEGATPIHIADDVFSDALESADGQRAFFTRSSRGPLSRDVPGIWGASSSGGDIRLVPELAGVVDSRHFSVTRRGIYFLSNELPPWDIRYFDFSSRRVSRIANLPRKPELFTHSLTISPDGRWMLYTQLDQVGSEITMLTNPQ